MNPENTQSSIYIILGVITVLVICIVYFIRKKRLEIVRVNSRKIERINNLNGSANFYDIDNPIVISRACSSKKEFDRLDFNDYLIACILEDHHYYRKELEKVRYNYSYYVKYCSLYETIMTQDSKNDKDLYDKYAFFKNLEEKECEKLKLHPTISLNVKAVKRYQSPQGRNDYSDLRLFLQAEVEDCYEQAKKAYFYKKTAQYQRDIMTDSLRYDVMKRDGFRCVLCGASAKDGAKLHVDHIIPVAKGGKTEMSNLRTLCSTCNWGKSDKYDPNGEN